MSKYLLRIYQFRRHSRLLMAIHESFKHSRTRAIILPKFRLFPRMTQAQTSLSI